MAILVQSVTSVAASSFTHPSMPDDAWARCPTLRTRQESTRVYSTGIIRTQSKVLQFQCLQSTYGIRTRTSFSPDWDFLCIPTSTGIPPIRPSRKHLPHLRLQQSFQPRRPLSCRARDRRMCASNITLDSTSVGKEQAARFYAPNCRHSDRLRVQGSWAQCRN
ncbi:hypothetical protein B9Z19DRAFT_1087311 [Tuber borchii]|uniref:Uncharacterized protein n=1 Tax=Tuber borchii TaxID=42251 RepID=A0A2T6ZN72_TUBBO|nr:hypothetical protein B9Z19DRAFT_1087311 [Tuber borchii]